MKRTAGMLTACLSRLLVGFAVLAALFAAVAGPACPGAEAATGGRIALVIGNGRYGDAPLRNPAHDAADVASALRELGFSVTLKTDATQEEMERSIESFTRQLKKGGTGFFFYAGHGMQIEGRNYLIPVGRDIRSEADVKYRSLDAGELLEKMERAATGNNIIILDACRNNPFSRSSRSAQRGLAVMAAPRNSIIVYSTAPGQTAADGEGRNGVFTTHLLKNMKTAGADIEQMLRKVRLGVQRETLGKQVPYTETNLTSDFSLNPVAREAASLPAPPAAVSDIPTREGERLATSVEPSTRLLDGVEITEKTRDDGVLQLLFLASGSSDAANSITWRVAAEREAKRKIKTGMETRLSQPPYDLSREKIDQVYQKARMVDLVYRDGEKSVALTYEILLKINRKQQ